MAIITKFEVRTSTGLRSRFKERYEAQNQAEEWFNLAGKLQVSPFSVYLESLTGPDAEGDVEWARERIRDWER